MPKQTGTKIVAQNKRARHDYFVLETWEAGHRAARGTEVKSIRLGKCNLKDCYGTVKDGETLGVMACTSVPMRRAAFPTRIRIRPKRMLMHKAEIRKAAGQAVMQKGLALDSAERLSEGRPHEGWKSALCKGKKLYDKRDDMAKRDAQRDIERSYAGRE